MLGHSIKRLLVAAFLAFGGAAQAAEQTLDNLGAASTLATGNLVPVFQTANPLKKSTLSDFSTFIMSQIYGGSLVNGVPIACNNGGTIGTDPTYRRCFEVNAQGDLTLNDPLFGDIIGGAFSLFPFSGDNSYGGPTSAKTTFAGLAQVSTMRAAGQRFGFLNSLTCLGMGDCFLTGKTLIFATADNVQGDEGVAWTAESSMAQWSPLIQKTITSIPTPATIATTTTQAITGSKSTQCVTVASTTGVTANQWIVVAQGVQTSSTTIEAVQVTSVGSGCLNGVFRNTQNSGVKVTAAKVLVVSGGSGLGQQRVLVNRSGTTYSTGTITGISGGGFTGSGTSWATNIVGGSADNIGAIWLTSDDLTAAPFGAGSAALHSIYQITSIGSATSLGIFSFSTAGDAAYHGNGVTGGPTNYTILPAARILHIADDFITLILETTTHTWTVGDTVEAIIPPYPDVSGERNRISIYTAGGARRSMHELNNTGARTFDNALSIRTSGGAIGTGGGSDAVAFAIGLQMSSINTGIQIDNALTSAVSLNSQFGGCTTDACGKITWNGTSIQPNSTNLGMDLDLIFSGTGGTLSSKSDSVIGTGASSLLTWTGIDQATARTFITLPTCASALEGARASVTNSDTAVWGATITASGAANQHVGAYCNGTNWTVYAK